MNQVIAHHLISSNHKKKQFFKLPNYSGWSFLGISNIAYYTAGFVLRNCKAEMTLKFINSGLATYFGISIVTFALHSMALELNYSFGSQLLLAVQGNIYKNRIYSVQFSFSLPVTD